LKLQIWKSLGIYILYQFVLNFLKKKTIKERPARDNSLYNCRL